MKKPIKRLSFSNLRRREWKNKDGFHRLHGPAVEYENGWKIWVVHGKFIGEEGGRFRRFFYDPSKQQGRLKGLNLQIFYEEVLS